MPDKRLIDIKRDSALSGEIGTADEGPIDCMISIGDSLYFIKPKAIYALKTADRIDPERTNIELPKAVTRQVFSVGSDSEIVGKILLTAISLLEREHRVREGVDTKHAISIALDALTAVLTMQSMAAAFDTAQENACANAALRPDQQPFLGDAEARCKGFMQQADHAVGALIKIVKLFYPDIKDKPWDALYKKIHQRLGAEAAFVKFLDNAIPFFNLVRNTRDSLEHKNAKGVVVNDFEVRADGQVHSPTIEVDFRKSYQPRVPIWAFMNNLISSLANGFEVMLAHLCSANIRSAGPVFPFYIDALPENRRRWKHVRFYYGVSMNGQFEPVR